MPLSSGGTCFIVGLIKYPSPKRDSVPEDYRWWRNRAKELIAQLIKLMDDGKASQPLEGVRKGNHESHEIHEKIGGQDCTRTLFVCFVTFVVGNGRIPHGMGVSERIAALASASSSSRRW